MNKPNLSSIFRSQVETGDVAEIDALLALARGERPADAERVLAQIARSPLNADLLRFARDLESDAAALSAEFASALRETAGSHRGAGAQRLTHRGVRRWRIGAALAASLIAAVAVWNVQHVQKATSMGAPVAQAPVASDRIFADLNDGAAARGRDEIFRGDFRADEVSTRKGHDG
jgi:hypothetical protein